MKGAIKQHVDTYLEKNEAETVVDFEKRKLKFMTEIFGSDCTANKAGKPTETQQGDSIFFTAHLMALPVRTNKVSYLLTTCPELIGFYEHLKELLGINSEDPLYEKVKALVTDNTSNQGVCFDNSYSGTELDIVGTSLHLNTDMGILSALQSLLNVKNVRIALVSDQTMAELCSDLYLPVITRNAIDDGESQNLWYEQILPRFTRLYFVNIWKSENQQKFVENTIVGNNKCALQVGGNASVSYGFTSISKF
jgi:CRISPR-associated protein Cmr4